MMKKLTAVLCAAVLCLSTAASVFAQPSPEVSGVVTGVSTGTDANGNAIEATVGEVPAEYQAAVDQVKDLTFVQNLLGDAFVEGMQVVDVKDVTVPEGTVFPATLSFNVTGVTADSHVAVLHYDTAAGAWEVVESKAGNGTITATFDSLSPVAFVVDGNAAAGSTAAGASSQTSGSATSPKTVETFALSMAAVIAAAALAGMAVVFFYSKKRA